MKGCILPFPKKSDLGLVKNYRGITVTSIAAKIYHALLRNSIAGGARGVMVIVAGYGHGDTSSNPGPD